MLLAHIIRATPLKQARILTILSYLIASILLLCSIWQLQRAQDKWPLLHLSDTHQPKISLTAPNLSKPYNYADWDITIDKQRYLLQTNTIHHKQSGYTVYGLGHHANSNTHILINLGWVQQKSQAKDLLHYQGTILWTEPKGFLLNLSTQTPTRSWPREINYLNIDELQQQTNLSLFKLVAISKTAPYYQTIHNQDTTLQALARHISYSVQFAILALLCFYYRYQLRNI